MEQEPVDEQCPDKPAPPQPDRDQMHPTEVGGRKGPEPTRYGDWEKRALHRFLACAMQHAKLPAWLLNRNPLQQ